MRIFAIIFACAFAVAVGYFSAESLVAPLSVPVAAQSANQNGMSQASQYSLSASSLQKGLNPEKALTQYFVRHWGTEEGLPSLTITSLLQTNDSYLWLTTFSGLVRFDGVQCTVFDNKNTPEIRVNALVGLCQDKHDNLWIASEGGGLLRYRNWQFTAFDKRHGLLSNVVMGIALEDKQEETGRKQSKEREHEKLWLATSKGLQQAVVETSVVASGNFSNSAIHNDTVRFLDNVLFRDEFIQKVFCDNEGVLWVIIRNKGVFRVQGARITHLDSAFPGIPFSAVTNIAQTPDSAIWMTTFGKGLVMYHRGNAHHITQIGGMPLEGAAFSLTADNRGTLWISGTTVLYRLYNGVLSSLRTNKRLLNASIIEDHEGNLWFGSYRAGLSRMQNGKFTAITAMEGLSDDAVHCIGEDSTGAMWIGTDNGLSVLNHGIFPKINASLSNFSNNSPKKKNSVTIYSMESGHLLNNTVRDVFCHTNGDMWVATGGGVSRFSAKARKFQHWTSAEGLANDRTRCVLASSHTGTVWIGTETGVSALYGIAETEQKPNGKKSGKQSSNQTTKQSAVRTFIPNVYVLSLAEDRTGTIWVGTNGHGLFSISSNGDSVRQYPTGFGLASKIFGVWVDEATSVLWLAVDNGICRFENGRTASMGEDQGLPKMLNTGQLLEDNEGWFWSLTSGYLMRIRKQYLENLANLAGAGNRWGDDTAATGGVQRNDSIMLFEKADGLYSASRSSNSRNCRSRDGNIWIATAGGVVVASPKNIPHNPFPPQVVIESLFLDDAIIQEQELALNERITIPAGVKKLSFNFTALCFTSPEKVRFRAQLEGFDDDAFLVAKNKRTLDYTNLPRGKEYVLRVTACNNDGVWNNEEARLVLYLKPFFWETAWFATLCALLLIVSGLGAMQWRLRYVRAKAKVLAEMVAERTRELEDANEEIRRQSFIQAEQAQEIEFVNTELQENNIQLQHLNETIQQRVAELETIDRIVQSINSELSFDALLHVLLIQGHELVANAEKSSILVFDETMNRYRFIAFYGYDPVPYLHLQFTPEEVRARYLNQQPIEEGVYIIREYYAPPESEQQFTTPPPLCSLTMTISFQDVVEGILFFDNYHNANAFTEDDIERFRRFRKHVISAFQRAKIMKVIHDSALRLSEQNQRLQELNQEKNEFLGIAAHDMKSPLAGIMMSVGLLRRYDARISVDERMRLLDSIETVSRRMSDIIANLLDINAIENGAMNLSLTELDIVQLVRQTLDDYRERAEAKQIVLHLITSQEACTALADPLKTAQILDNLISNAVKYSPHGKTVRVRVWEESANNTTPSRIRVSVQDEGKGLSEEDKQKLFGKFARLSTKPTGGEDSTGLGLSIVKRLTEAMNGRVWCESEEGKGTVFIVELPSGKE